MSRENWLFVQDICDAIHEIAKFVGDMEFNAYLRLEELIKIK